jgi:uncharacterized protein YndB with AHSA1/START domain
MTDTGNDLVLQRILNAPLEKLWRCWTEPALLEQWFCPKPWYVTDARIDLKPGGEFSTVMNGPNGERFANTGCFLHVQPGARLIFTDAFGAGWRPAGTPFMVAEVCFGDAGNGKTDYTARAMHWTEEARRKHEEMGFREGWGIAADQLEVLALSI